MSAHGLMRVLQVPPDVRLDDSLLQIVEEDGEQQQETNCHRKAEPAGKRVGRRRDVYSGGRR